MGTCDGMINNKVPLFVSALGGAEGFNRFSSFVSASDRPCTNIQTGPVSGGGSGADQFWV